VTSSSASAASGDKKSGKTRLLVGCIVGLLVGLFVGHAITWHWVHAHEGDESFQTPFQAVLLVNGAVYYGKLQGYGTHHPTMTDVFYIMSRTDPNTKQVTNVLVKRGKELHAPDRMYLNANQIVFVEPVGQDSKVAQLINEANH
jgi:hypothetical protein